MSVWTDNVLVNISAVASAGAAVLGLRNGRRLNDTKSQVAGVQTEVGEVHKKVNGALDAANERGDVAEAANVDLTAVNTQLTQDVQDAKDANPVT
jgi:hypothetical protein